MKQRGSIRYSSGREKSPTLSCKRLWEIVEVVIKGNGECSINFRGGIMTRFLCFLESLFLVLEALLLNFLPEFLSYSHILITLLS